MATLPKKKVDINAALAGIKPGGMSTLSSYYNPISNPGGGLPGSMANSTPAMLSQNNNRPNLSGALIRGASAATMPMLGPIPSALGALYSGTRTPAPTPNPNRKLVMPNVPAGPQSLLPTGATGPSQGSVFGGSQPLAQGPSNMPINDRGPQKPSTPSQWMNPDGTMKTPEQIASEIAANLKSSQGNGDIGTLAGNEFGGGQKTAEQLQAEAAQTNNARNDIAVGANDPYKVAARSGIAYTPQELKAIESAYAGIYDPALTTALAKVQAKQDEDKAAADRAGRLEEMRYGAELDARAPYTLGKDQVRYDGNGNPIAVGLSDTDTSGGVYTPGANPTVDAYVQGRKNGTYKASDVPDEIAGLVAQGLAQVQPAIPQASTDAISVINQLIDSGNLENISGFRITDPSSLFPGTAVQSTMNLGKQLKGMLSLENRGQLQGSGAISDFEFRVLGDASSALGIDENGRTNLSPTEFENELNKLKLKLEVGETALTDDELIHLQSKGYTPAQIRELSNPSFNSVGNTTASTGQGNRPQRNNNPGNVKSGGLADSLAVGTDDQGHLIFPDANAGFQALMMDLTAKVNGASRHLPANPTIAQLGRVYAEDPNWPNSVARMLGVNPNTPTQSIPIQQLAQAVATQEGYYA